MVKFSGRKGRALRWLTALAAILLVNFFLNLYPLFPGQALAALDANYATRDMETLQMIRDGAWRVYLRQSPSDFSLSFLKWTILEGWQPWIQGPTISWGDNQLYGFYRLQNDEEMVVYLFGFVADGEEPPTLGISLPGRAIPTGRASSRRRWSPPSRTSPATAVCSTSPPTATVSPPRGVAACTSGTSRSGSLATTRLAAAGYRHQSSSGRAGGFRLQ